MIQIIDINKVHNHPDNLRKELGDLTELAESIKANGILQNLTLVPIEDKEGEFYTVIGNRRLAAARLAGLTEVPAAIKDMDHKTQIKTMLLENMQRSDLTPYEEAQGIQMMLDLGESFNDIKEKTGLSETKLRNRTKLLSLDEEKFKESIERGGNLKDYIELDKIEDAEERNKVLEKVGTNDFNWSLSKALEEQKEKKEHEKRLNIVKSFATETEDTKELSFQRMFGPYRGTVEIPPDAETYKYFYTMSGKYIYLYKEKVVEEVDQDKKEEEELQKLQFNENRKELESATARAYTLRKEFIESLTNTKAKKNMTAIIKTAIYAMSTKWDFLNFNNMADIMGIEIEMDEDRESKDVEWEDIEDKIWEQPELYLLKEIYYTLDDNLKYYNYSTTHNKEQDLDVIYELLTELGYKMSEEEKQLQDGTHELFKKEVSQ